VPGEQLPIRVLESQSDTLRQRGHVDPSNVEAVHQHSAGRRPQQSVEVTGQRGLPGPVLADDGHQLPRLDAQLDILECPGAVG